MITTINVDIHRLQYARNCITFPSTTHAACNPCIVGMQIRGERKSATITSRLIQTDSDYGNSSMIERKRMDESHVSQIIVRFPLGNIAEVVIEEVTCRVQAITDGMPLWQTASLGCGK